MLFFTSSMDRFQRLAARCLFLKVGLGVAFFSAWAMAQPSLKAQAVAPTSQQSLSPTITVDTAACNRWLKAARHRTEKAGVDMPKRATPTLKALGSAEARACGALSVPLMDAAKSAAGMAGAQRLDVLQVAGFSALAASCPTVTTSLALWAACPPPAVLKAAVSEDLVRDLAKGEAAFAVAVAQALDAHGLLASGGDGERLMLTLLLSLARARAG